MLVYFILRKKISLPVVRTSFGLDPKTGMYLGPTSPNNKFVKRGRKSQYESRKKISVVSVQEKKVMRAKYKKHPRLSPNGVINSLEFFLFFVIFLKPLFFSLFLLSFLFMLYTMIFTPFSPYTCESGIRSFPAPSHTSLNLLLLAVRLLVYCSGITFTLMRPESWLGSI